MFKIKTIKLLGSIKIKIAEHEHGEYVAYLKITKVILIHRNVVNNSFQQNSRVWYTFDPNKLFSQ